MQDSWRRRLLVDDLLDLVWPIHCPLCGRWIATEDKGVVVGGAPSRPLLHKSCWRGLARECMSQGHRRGDGRPRPLREGAPVRWALADDPRFFRLLHAVKYGGEPALLLPLARLLSMACRRYDWLCREAILVPLPDDARRRRSRGFGVTLTLARVLAHGHGLRIEPRVLRRCRVTPPQASLEGVRERFTNASSVYGVGSLSELSRHSHLVLVEDQVTTGATIGAALRVLGARGNPVSAIALAGAARAPRQVGLDTDRATFLEWGI